MAKKEFDPYQFAFSKASEARWLSTAFGGIEHSIMFFYKKGA